MGQSTTAGEVRQVTSEAERKYGLPAGTLYKMAGIESNYKPGAVSPKGAQGWFQFMPATAKEYGLDDPSDLLKASDAAGRKMRDLLKKHGGEMSYALVDYNGGGRAVQALKEGTPWAESAGYLQKFNVEAPAGRAPVTPMGEQFTSQTTAPLQDGPSATALGVAKRQQDNEFGGVGGFVGNLPRAVSLGFQTQNSVWNYFQDQGVADSGDGLDWESPEAKEALSQVPERHWGYLTQAHSKDGLTKRLGRLQEVMGQEEELGRMGMGLGLTGGIVGSLPDLPTLIGFLPGIGGAGLMTKTSRIANAARMAAVGGASNVAYDAVANQYKPTATSDDLYMSALFGIGLGALGGASVNPRIIGLREENLRLREYGLKMGTAGLRKEIDDALPKPATVVPFEAGPRDEFLKKLDVWAGGMGRQAPEKPKLAILSGGPEDAPSGPKAGLIYEPAPTPKGTPTEPSKPVVENPSGDPWGEEWNAPRRVTRMGAPDILILPSVGKISHMADYVRKFSTNKDIVALMDRALKGLDLRKVKFAVIDPGSKPLGVSGATSRHMSGAYGVVMTPQGSRGDGIEMALRGHGWGKENGLNEETFVHELLHAATVYKWHRVHNKTTEGMRVESIQAYKELDKLYRKVKKSSADVPRAQLPERFDVNMANPREFISYGLTNRPFQEWLKTVQIDGARTSLWTHFTDALRKMLGMSKEEGNAYARLIDLTDGLLEKSGIEGTARTNAELAARGSYIDADDVAAANAAGVSPVFGWGLGLEHRLMGEKIPAAVRNVASKLFGTTVGHKGHAVVERNAWDDTIAMSEGWKVETRKVGYAAFDSWFKQSGAKWHNKGEAFEQFGEQVSNYIRGFEGDFHPDVVKAGQKIQEMNAKIVDLINNPAHTEGGLKKGLTEIEVLDEATGQTMLVGKLEKNPNYLPRKHDAQKWDEAVRTWGREAVESWWANAYAKVHPERSADDAKKWAGWYTRTVEEAHMNRSTDHLEEMMTGFDEKALKESLIRNGGFDSRGADDVIRGMFQKPSNDAGRTASSLRHRNTISETHTETWKNSKGETVEVTLNDFIQSNALDVQESYYRRVASSVSLANRLDIYKQSDIGRIIDKATEKGFGSTVSDADAAKMRDDLKFAFDRVQGIPQEEWKAVNKSLEMWRDFNVIRLMGGAVWNQVTELSQIVGSMGWKATFNAVGELRALRRDIKSGKAPNDFLDHLENTIGGVGSDYVSRLDFSPKDDWVRYKGDTAMNQRLDKLDSGLKKVAKGVLDYTGMTPVMIQQKRIHAIALTNHFVNDAVGNAPASTFLSEDRLAWMGMSRSDYNDLKAGIKAYSKANAKGEYGAKVDFDFKKFAAEKPELNSMLMNAIHRESRRVVQENDLASMVPLMGTTLGKTVFQFMNFTIHGWNKSMLFAMNHKDFSTVSTMAHASFFASLAYMGRTQLSAMGLDEGQRQEFLAMRLDSKQIVANSFGKMAQASLLPQVYDTFAGPFTGPMFSGMRTTSDLSSFASNPTLQAANSVLSLGKMVRNGFSDETQTTQRDIKAWAKLVPLNNVAPISTYFNALANDYPTTDKESD